MFNPNVGFGFPFRFTEDGKTSTVGGRFDEAPTVGDLDAAVQAGIQQILVTEKAERVMLCQFGVGAGRFLFSPLSHMLGGFIAEETREQLEWFCQRATPSQVRAQVVPGTGTLLIDMAVKHKQFSDDEAVLKVRMARNG